MDDWKWQSFGNGWRRTSYIVSGYDCRVVCRHTPRGKHGICADAWWYVVSDGECALSLDVRSANYPDTVALATVFDRTPKGCDLSLHVPWNAAGDDEDTEEAIRKGDGSGSSCEFVEGGRCWLPRSTSLGADEFFRAHGMPAFEQPASFWTAFRSKATEWIAAEKQDRARLAHLHQCPTCKGRGVVEVKKEQA